MKYILYNQLSRNGKCVNDIEAYINEPNATVVSVLDKEKTEEVIKCLKKEDSLILVGGDGTLNHFVNDFKDVDFPCNVFFNTAGTGNDFYKDVKNENDEKIIRINDLIKNLPKVIVNDKEYLFINGVGFGIDGYCCEKGDILQKKSTKPVNYSSIAIKGLLFHYKRPNAKITVDGVTKEYKNVWLAPTMKGRYYGGGMMVAPNQDRNLEDNSVTNVVLYKSRKLKTLIMFPSLFKGAHVKYTKYVDIRKGKHIIVEFDRPTALQIDGETIVGVTRYEVIA